MPTSNPWSRLRVVFLAACVSIPQTACDQWALVINGDGLLLVTVVGDGNVQDRFRVRARQSDGTSQTMDVPASGNLALGSFPAGQLELTLLAPEGCSVAAPNPRTLIVNADEPVNVGFEVRCGSS
jgi:hypothetical protein